jgi:hypothetical protein
MSAPPRPIQQPNQLDEAVAFVPDPRWWSENLAALARHQPELADRLRATALPPYWRCVRALCGSPSYQIQKPGEPVVWLAGSSAPRTRATSFLGGFHVQDKNPGLPSIAAGCEVGLLLERLPPWVAVFVFEEDISALTAVLRIMPVAQALSSQRLILVPPPPADAEAFLDGLLDREPGLLPPANLLRLPGVSAERVENCGKPVSASATRRWGDQPLASRT